MSINKNEGFTPLQNTRIFMSSANKWASRKEARQLNDSAKARLKERLDNDVDFFNFVAEKATSEFERKGYYKVLEVTSSCIRIKPDPKHLPDLIRHFEFQAVKIKHEKLVYWKNQWGEINRSYKDMSKESGFWCNMHKPTNRKGYGWFARWEDVEEIRYPMSKFVAARKLDVEYLSLIRERYAPVDELMGGLRRGGYSHLVIPQKTPIEVEKENGERKKWALPYDWAIKKEDILQEIVTKGITQEELTERQASIQKAALERSKKFSQFYSPPKEEDLSELLHDVIDYQKGLNNRYGLSYIDAPENIHWIVLYPKVAEKKGIRFKAVWIRKADLVKYANMFFN